MAKQSQLARTKYARHKAQSKYRGIEFKFAFEEWYAWWLSHGVDKNIDHFAIEDCDRPCMCRYNDTGAYEPNNVYFATQRQNTRDAGMLRGEHTRQVELERKKKQEWRKLCIAYTLDVGLPDANTWWPTGTGAYVPTKKQAEQITPYSTWIYRKKLRLGELKRKFVAQTFEDYVQEHSVYDEPYSYEYRKPNNRTYHRRIRQLEQANK